MRLEKCGRGDGTKDTEEDSKTGVRVSGEDRNKQTVTDREGERGRVREVKRR